MARLHCCVCVCQAGKALFTSVRELVENSLDVCSLIAFSQTWIVLALKCLYPGSRIHSAIAGCRSQNVRALRLGYCLMCFWQRENVLVGTLF